ncbi:MAG TPA: SAM-dependent chlorinase/fluorinase [Candidatus Obscuribacterales bacterium]
MRESTAIVTLTTDFGSVDGYTGQLKAVLLNFAPRATVVDISHEVKPGDIQAAAWIVSSAYSYFPRGTVHVAVVDPGVGSQRRAILLVCDAGAFIGPDNGIFSPVIEREKQLAAYDLNNPDYWLHPVSSTFHGRDIFAPVAGRLASGLAPEKLGTTIGVETLTRLPDKTFSCGKGWVEGEIVYIDRFGNLITNIPASLAAQGDKCFIDSRQVARVASTYASGEPGQALAIAASHGCLEIAVCRGSAADLLGARVGSAVRLEAGR